MTKLEPRFRILIIQIGFPGQAYKFRQDRINHLNFPCCHIQNHLIAQLSMNNVSPSSSPSLKKRDRGNENFARATQRLMKRCNQMSRRYETDVYVVLRRKNRHYDYNSTTDPSFPTPIAEIRLMQNSFSVGEQHWSKRKKTKNSDLEWVVVKSNWFFWAAGAVGPWLGFVGKGRAARPGTDPAAKEPRKCSAIQQYEQTMACEHKMSVSKTPWATPRTSKTIASLKMKRPRRAFHTAPVN
ncbi:hypothetical protein B0T10DRAFT_463520 [Thelonectria olida]|uniref:Uncharacterized protein n=1 Tax=Thelonectria olida TaxID=1576542 RepID=A0A9P8VY40_9HYPO|nr:hypothetical protein B0T10DRAFT_463520 [Thelonectria olida]